MGVGKRYCGKCEITSARAGRGVSVTRRARGLVSKPGPRSALLLGVFVVTGLLGSSAAARTPAACKRIPRHVVVDLNDDKHNEVIDHAFDARRAGHPRILHIRRLEAKANRRASLRGIPTKKGFDRDEYPPAISDEGGKGASVRYIKSVENRSAGALMGRQLATTATSKASSSNAEALGASIRLGVSPV
jgi:hypothetical protein